MSRKGAGMPAGMDMTQGMGMLNGSPGAPMGEDYGPSLGRGMGVGSTNSQAVANGTMQRDMSHMQHGMPGMQMGPDVAKDANSVPGFPQDAYMEGPMMAMDKMVERPENYGLRPGWSGFMQGMMNFVRVLPPDKYEQIMARRRQ
jgi:hypothetical protein